MALHNFKLLLFTLLFTAISIQGNAQSYIPLKNDSRIAVQPKIPIHAYAVPLQDVRLLDSPFKTALEADKRYLLSLEPDRFLNRFHLNAGLPVKGAIYGGWESKQVSGFSLGHYLSAMAMLYATTDDTEIKTKIDYSINELKRCQDARGTGYVGGIPNEDQLWNEIAAGDIRKRYGYGYLNDVWVPWYTQHKLFAGLLDVYLYTGNEQAKTIVVNMANWICEKFKNLTKTQWQLMLSCEFGGMNDVLYNLYALTGESKYLQMAEKFYHHAVLDPLEASQDQLVGLHANTQVPKVIGISRNYELSGSKRDSTIANFFWETVVHDHSYCIGGLTNHEHFHQPHDLSEQLSNQTAETCITYNMLKLTRHLFAHKADAKYMDYYEKALYNHILASQNPNNGMICYYVPLVPGGKKQFSAPDDFWCCVGTGMENHVKYGEEIYSYGENNELYVNLFIASELDWKAINMKVRQETNFPNSDQSQLKITCSAPQKATLKIRYPSWVTSGFAVKINGKKQIITGVPGSYIAINRKWKNGDIVEINLPKTLWKEALLGDKHKTAFFYGPLVLAGDIQPGKMSPVFLNNNTPLPEWIIRENDNTLAFHTKDGFPYNINLAPFYQKYETNYTVYFDCFTPKKWVEIKDEYIKEQEIQLEIKRSTLDYFRPNEQQQEIDHNFSATNLGRGRIFTRQWCDAGNGGYLSIDMKVNPDLPVFLRLTYWGDDGGNRQFDILIDDEVIASEQLTGGIHPNAFFEISYPIPLHLTKGNNKVTVKLQAKPNNTAGSIFGARMYVQDANTLIGR
ncbi:glycosyl hydrolase [Bacteroidia bacterium]|nr:glycosyl hydrolase [Bacteroidia bacterium]GHV20091.1 glycosyl hydrolase [Bacteroidia bacterium]